MFAQVTSRGKEALPINRLKEAMLHDELLQKAIHVLRNNIDILDAFKSESLKRQRHLGTPGKLGNDGDICNNFCNTMDNTIRDLAFTRNQLELCSKRLQGSSVRDIVTLQSTYATEEMTKTTIIMAEKSVQEARAVRIIAIVTLLYLPPTFTAVGEIIFREKSANVVVIRHYYPWVTSK